MRRVQCRLHILQTVRFIIKKFLYRCTGKELFPGSDFHDILKINKKCNINLENLSIYRTPPEAVDLL